MQYWDKLCKWTKIYPCTVTRTEELSRLLIKFTNLQISLDQFVIQEFGPGVGRFSQKYDNERTELFMMMQTNERVLIQRRFLVVFYPSTSSKPHLLAV